MMMEDFRTEQESLIREENNEEENSTNRSSNINTNYEKALSAIGFGKFHLLLLFICGLANSSDAIEILCVSFVLPSAECDLNMSSTDKGYLSSITFLGMMIGGYVWGTLGDVLGRKYILISALFFNALFGILAGLSQTFEILLLCRFLSGIGVGGSVPIVWSYFSEFIPKDIRGRMICCLASSWFFGNLLVILFAYILLNNFQINISLFSGYIIINNWKMFMIASALPSAITCVLLLMLPESPKFCLYNGKSSEARKILKNIFIYNNGNSNPEKKRILNEILDDLKLSERPSLSDNDDDRELLFLPNRTTRFTKSIIQNSKDIIKKTKCLFSKAYIFKTSLILCIMFAICFGYYGLWIWLPELYKRMALTGGSPCSKNFIPTNGTDNTNKSCRIDNSVFESSFISALSNLPGNLFTIFFIDKMGRNIVTSMSLILSGLSVFGIPFITKESQGVLLATIFGGINVVTFNSFGCTATELYPTKLRSSALGVQYVAGRLGAILGNILFGVLVDTSCYVPLLTISGLLIMSGILSFKLPESSNLDMD
ncbi:synaptic vesicle glyco 2B-like [Brachionus plicatilis]|uniref:Synaptic vesicle glyco 2B-like n=1 Tax=Brachionus plicatilis TaxID=10195 RepID=A0A3M7S0E6_BRAPC|nr:synaptic vesicle glyco 2B-like [Brachionus plicatilis]